MLIQGRDLHIDQPLSNVMLGRRPDGFIVDQLVPLINVGKQSDLYYKSNYLEHIMYVPDMDRRAKFAESREVYFSMSSDSYYAQNFALGTKWSTEDIVNADDPIKFRQRAARQVTDRLLISYEARVAALAGAAASVGTTTHVATAWSNTTGSRVYDDLCNIKELFRASTTLTPNVLIIPEEAMTYVRRNDQVRDIVFGDRGGIATDGQIGNLVNCKILVPRIMVNTQGVLETKIGSGTKAAVWPKKAFFAYVADLQSGDEADTWITAFRWTSPDFGVPFAIRTFGVDQKTRSEKVEASYYQTEKVISADLGIAVDSII